MTADARGELGPDAPVEASAFLDGPGERDEAEGVPPFDGAAPQGQVGPDAAVDAPALPDASVERGEAELLAPRQGPEVSTDPQGEVGPDAAVDAPALLDTSGAGDEPELSGPHGGPDVPVLPPGEVGPDATVDAPALDSEQPSSAVFSACGMDYPACPDRLGRNPHTDPDHDDCTDGRWPDGRIVFRFATADYDSTTKMPTGPQQQIVTNAMADWEMMASGIIHFAEQPNATHSPSAPVLTIYWGGGRAAGYRTCTQTSDPTTCALFVTEDSVYHELGHAISPSQHQQRRYDRNHYLHFHSWMDGTNVVDPSAGEPRCPVPANDPLNLVDYGPFDYRSTMLLPYAYPAATRPLDRSRQADTAGVMSSVCSSGARREMASNGFYAPQCPGCSANNDLCCVHSQPQGFPTAQDGSNTIENYRNLLDGGWKKFLRTVDEDLCGPPVPFDYDIAATDGAIVSIPSTSSPAVETWGRDSIAIYLRGSDGNIYKKYKDNTTPGSETWSGWEKLDHPPGAITSDPAVVSWAAGRTDLAATVFDADGAGSGVYIRTYKDGWQAWQPLPSLPDATKPASAPAITSAGSDSLFVAVRGSDDQLYFSQCSSNCLGGNAGFSSWTSVYGAFFRGKPALVYTSASPARVCAFVHGNDDRVWTNCYQSSAWTGWSAIPSNGTMAWNEACPDCSSPAAAAFGDKIHVYIRGRDSRLWFAQYGASGWTAGYTGLGGVLVSSPGTVTRVRDANRSDTVGIMAEERDIDELKYGVWWKAYRP